MTLATTTLSTALTGEGPLAETSIVVASATSMAAGRIIRMGGVGGERMLVAKAYTVGSTTVPVIRGWDGSVPKTWPASANVVHGEPSDFASNPVGSTTSISNFSTVTAKQYSASGAITFGDAAITYVQLIGTSTLTMTLALPTKDQDGQVLHVHGNAKSQSTVATTTAGFANAGASYDTYTFQNAGDVGFSVMAVNGFWNVLNTPITGTSTAFSIAIA
jgi:hypothetical protein